MVVTLNGHKFAESITNLKYNPKNYEGYVRRYKNALEIYSPDLSPLAVINRYGVILGFTKDATGKKGTVKLLFTGKNKNNFWGGKMESIVWEVIMKNEAGRVWNGFFSTLKDAERKYHEYQSLNWTGDVFRREVCYD